MITKASTAPVTQNIRVGDVSFHIPKDNNISASVGFLEETIVDGVSTGEVPARNITLTREQIFAVPHALEFYQAFKDFLYAQYGQ